MKSLFTLVIVALVYVQVLQTGNFYTLVKTDVPLSNIIKTIPDVTRRICLQKCRLSKTCEYAAIDVKRNECLHLNNISIPNGQETVSLGLLQELPTDKKVVREGTHITSNELKSFFKIDIEIILILRT